MKKKATFPDRRKAQRICRSLQDRYGQKRAWELIGGISQQQFSFVVNMTRRIDRNTPLYQASHESIFRVLDQAKKVVLG